MTTATRPSPDLLSTATGRHVPTTSKPPACVDLQAERAVLAAVLLDGAEDGRYGVWRRVVGMLSSEDFYHPPNAVLWEAFAKVLALGRDLDVVTCAAQLREMERINTVGGIQYVGELTDEIPTLSHCESHAAIVAELAARRRLGTTLATHARILAAGGGTAAEVQAKALADVRAVRLPGSKMPTVSDDTMAWAERMERRLKGTDTEIILPTSCSDLNEALQGGWRTGLNLVGSRPNIGKTMLMTQEVLHVAKTQGRVFYLSLEARRAQIMDAMVSCLSGVPLSLIMRPQTMEQDDINATFRALEEIDKLPITVVDMATRGCPRTVPTLESAILTLPDAPVMLAIDHIRKMRPVGKHDQLRTGIGEVSEQLHDLGLSMGMAINAIIHINRGIKGATCRLPTMEDLKESGDLEENADSVVILHSEFRYPTEKYAKGSEPPRDIIDVYVPKLRNAQAGGFAKLRQNGAVQRFFSTMSADGPLDATIDPPAREPDPFADDGRVSHVAIRHAAFPALPAPQSDSVFERVTEGLPDTSDPDRPGLAGIDQS